MKKSSSESNKLVYSTETGDLRKSGNSPFQSLVPVSTNKQKISVTLDTKSRRGKTMTAAAGFQESPEKLESLLKQLKTQCGAGGTVEENRILIQGDHRQKVIESLKKAGYQVK